jgi:hypothetical protein
MIREGQDLLKQNEATMIPLPATREVAWNSVTKY